MKNLKLILFFLPLMMFMLHSCEEAQPGVPVGGAVVTTPPATTPPTDTPPTTTPPVTTTDFVNYKVDGSDRKSTGTTQVSGAYYEVSKTVQIIGGVGAKEVVNIFISKFDGNKKYTTNDTAMLDYITDVTNPNTHFLGTEGSVTVTSLVNNVITGTFEFKAETTAGAKKTVSSGSFSVKLINI